MGEEGRQKLQEERNSSQRHPGPRPDVSSDGRLKCRQESWSTLGKCFCLWHLEAYSKVVGSRSLCVTLPWDRHVFMSSRPWRTRMKIVKGRQRAKPCWLQLNSKYEEKEIWKQKRVYGKSSCIFSLPSRYFKWQTVKSNMKTIELPETHEKGPGHCSSKQLIMRAILL